MVKYFALALAIAGSLSLAGVAEAGRRHGCASCGGCPGGYCGVPVMPAPAPVPGPAPAPPPAAAAPQAAPVVVASAPTVVTQTAPAYYARRGLFRRR